MNELVLKTTEMFGEVQTDIYENENYEIFVTIEQLASCLDYADRKGIEKMIERNAYLKDEEFSVTVKLSATDGKKYNTRVFTEDGIYEVTMLARTEKAKEFRRWVRRLLKFLRRGNVNLITKAEYALLQNQIIETNKILSRLETKAPAKPDYWRWKNNISSPLTKQIADKFGIEKREVFDLIYDTMTSKYGFDRSFAINQMCCKYNTTEEYVIDVIADNPEYQRWFFEVATDILQDNINIHSSSDSISPIVENHLDKVQQAIQPLIDKYGDVSPHGAVTYRCVYKTMNKSNHAWNVIMSRNGYKNRKEVIKNNANYFKAFVKAVNILLLESKVNKNEYA